MKKILKKIIPDWIIRNITGLFYGWHGNYKNWEAALKECTGYDSENIINKVREAAKQVKNGNASYERDSVLYKEPEYSENLSRAVTVISSEIDAKINVLDFGGSLGSTYFQNKHNIGDKISKWCIIEQKEFVREGKKNFEDDILQFYNTIDECLNIIKPDLIILSSVLQYLKEPYKVLNNLINRKPRGIFIDRTPFISEKDRITIQKVRPGIYKASYPCWFFNKKKFTEFMSENYKLVSEFEAVDRANIKSEFKGFFYELMENQ